MDAQSSERFLSNEQVLRARLCQAAAHRPHRSVERCCHISRGLRELSEASRARISDRVLERRFGHAVAGANMPLSCIIGEPLEQFALSPYV